MVRKLSFKLTSMITLCSLLLIPVRVSAQNLDSTNYRILDATLDSGGGISSSSNYGLLGSIGDFSSDPRLNSTTYTLKGGIQPLYEVNVPEVQCFETNTNGSSSCQSGPSYLNTGGMVRVCGNPGCYNRARFEIDANNNPTDTLYSVQISTDNFASDIRYIDGISLMPETGATRSLADYLTKSAWETPSTNLLGLSPSTTYYIRLTAVQGDFTETGTSPVSSATTTAALISFDLDIGSTSGVATESAEPYIVNIGTMYRSSPAKTSLDLIWFDADSNAISGVTIVQRGLYGGLNSASNSFLIPSATADLGSAALGFGLQKYYTSQSFQSGGGAGELGTLTAQTAYNNSGNNVGIISTGENQIFYSSAPLRLGRGGIYVMARVDGTVPVGTDYTETVYFTIAGMY